MLRLNVEANHYTFCAFLFFFLFFHRVLLERLVVNRPHPWGLLITFIELIKNPRYAFWDHSFTRIDPDIEKLFDSVSRSVKRSM